LRNLSIVVFLLCLFVTSPVIGDPSVGTSFYWQQGGTYSPYMLTVDAKINMQYYNSASSNGGAFWVDLLDGSLGPHYPNTPVANNVFSTWCVEKNVYFYLNTDYCVSIDPKAYSGGNSGFGGDPISNVTEFIYDKWLADYYAKTNAEQVALRDAIHYAEGELTSLVSGSRAEQIYNEAVSGVGTIGNANHTYALNLWGGWYQDSYGNWIATDVQTQLITVPVPAAVLLGLLGLGAAGLKLRKFA